MELYLLLKEVTKSRLALLCGLVFFLGTNSLAAPPHPNLEAEIESGQKAKPPFLERLSALRAQGVCTGAEHHAPQNAMKLAGAGLAPGANGSSAAAPFRVLTILVDFSDKASSVSPIFFDTLVYENLSGTVRHYYNEISYGQLDIVTVNLPSALGWKTAPQTYSYYTNSQNGIGAYPQNTQKLVEDIVDLINPIVDFSVYDNDLDGTVDFIALIHTGPGAEFTGSPNDIWSHKWSISPRTLDGVTVRDFTVQPEYWSAPGDMTCGVFTHELGHAFGLPDLYDLDGSSWGLGRWSLMAVGSWNGPSSLGESPSHPDAWSRIQMGFATATNITTNSVGTKAPSVNSGNNIFSLWTGGVIGSEYFLVENRQKTGYDSYIPNSGIIIWHIDETQSNNSNEWYPGNTASGNYLVALEQADGLWNLEKNGDPGSSGDPFPGLTNNIDFSPSTTPNSNSYSGITTFVGVTNISPSADTMTVNFTVALAAGLGDEEDITPLPNAFTLYQNYPNPFNPSTTISFYNGTGGNVTVTVYNVIGQEVTVVSDGYYPAGSGEVVWNGTNTSGESVSSGVYFYEVVTEEVREVRTMTLLK
ncbi:MAG: M6 family metalloprotease domain-containing protein [candidate division Zixibacteria bacterium]|nr:M6 family metalloprotease domain-containing protein [candidate division Zixibacteria bacterium]